jgi:organic hydroperoxide reductase OsmC/OhrA
MSLTVSAMVPGIDEDKFNRIVDAATMTCPISQALWCNVEIDMVAGFSRRCRCRGACATG